MHENCSWQCRALPLISGIWKVSVRAKPILEGQSSASAQSACTLMQMIFIPIPHSYLLLYVTAGYKMLKTKEWECSVILSLLFNEAQKSRRLLIFRNHMSKTLFSFKNVVIAQWTRQLCHVFEMEVFIMVSRFKQLARFRFLLELLGEVPGSDTVVENWGSGNYYTCH